MSEQAVDFSTGTNLGNMTGEAGINAVFDGNTNQGASASSQRLAADGYAGRSFAAGKKFSRFTIHGTNDNGYTDTGGAGSVTITFYGKNGAPSSGTDGASLGVIGPFSDNVNESTGRSVNSTDQVTAYTHVWAYIADTGGTGAVRCAEILAWELVAAKGTVFRSPVIRGGQRRN